MHTLLRTSSRPYIGYVLCYPRASAHTCSFPVAPLCSSAHLELSSRSTVALQVSLMLTLVSYSQRPTQAPLLALFAAVTKSSRPGDIIKNKSLFRLLFGMLKAQRVQTVQALKWTRLMFITSQWGHIREER